MKKQKTFTFAKRFLNINALMIKIIVKLKTIVTIMKNVEVMHKTCNLKQSIRK